MPQSDDVAKETKLIQIHDLGDSGFAWILDSGSVVDSNENDLIGDLASGYSVDVLSKSMNDSTDNWIDYMIDWTHFYACLNGNEIADSDSIGGSNEPIDELMSLSYGDGVDLIDLNELKDDLMNDSTDDLNHLIGHWNDLRKCEWMIYSIVDWIGSIVGLNAE